MRAGDDEQKINYEWPKKAVNSWANFQKVCYSDNQVF